MSVFFLLSLSCFLSLQVEMSDSDIHIILLRRSEACAARRGICQEVMQGNCARGFHLGTADGAGKVFPGDSQEIRRESSTALFEHFDGICIHFVYRGQFDRDVARRNI